MTWQLPRLKELYEKRCTSVEAAFQRIRPGWRIFIGTGCAEHRHLVKSLTRFPAQFADAEILHLIHLLPLYGRGAYAAPHARAAARGARLRREFRHRGHCGRRLERADQKGISGFTAEVLAGNRKM